MRRLMMAVGVMCLAPTFAQPQDGGLSLKGGLSYGNVSNSGVLPGSATQRSGIAIGVGMMSGGTVGFGLDVLFAQRGFDNRVVADSRKLDYLDVPVYLRLAFPMTSVMPFVFAGPQVSFELKCGAGSFDCPDTGRPKASYAGVIGVGLGLGARHTFSVEGRYVYGLTDLKLDTVTSSTSYQTRSFLLLAGIGF